MTPTTFAPLALSLLATTARARDGEWPGWRGPGASGAGAGSPPIEWSETKNVRWKAPLRGLGHGSPIVWGARVFVVGAAPTGRRGPDAPPAERDPGLPPYAPIEEQELAVSCLERASGREAWRTVVARAMPHQAIHPASSYATPTPATDGERVHASFGSLGIYALTHSGEVAWRADLGDLAIDDELGEASSPVLCGDALVLLWDHEGDSFLVALDKATGEERWRAPRPGGTSWSTPIVVRAGGADAIVVGGGRTVAYDAASGRELWALGGELGGGGHTPSPVAVDDLVLCAVAGRRGGEVRAFALSAEPGARAESLWTARGDVPSVPSPLHHDGRLYFLEGSSGVLRALDLVTGEAVHGPERLRGVVEVHASPVVAAGRMYVAGRDGTCEVLSLPDVETLAVNVLEDAFDASPALAGDELFLRGHASLYCIAATL